MVSRCRSARLINAPEYRSWPCGPKATSFTISQFTLTMLFADAIACESGIMTYKLRPHCSSSLSQQVGMAEVMFWLVDRQTGSDPAPAPEKSPLR